MIQGDAAQEAAAVEAQPQVEAVVRRDVQRSRRERRFPVGLERLGIVLPGVIGQGGDPAREAMRQAELEAPVAHGAEVRGHELRGKLEHVRRNGGRGQPGGGWADV